MRRVVWLGLAAALIAGAGVVIAAKTPFGGDDTGFVPPSLAIAKCELAVGKGVGKMVAGLIKCHRGRVNGKIPDETGEDACEDAVQQKFVDKVGSKTSTCAACTNLDTIKGVVESLIDGNNNKVYCGPGTAWGGEDSGNIPTDTALAKCENGVAKGVAKLISAIIKCHASRAVGRTTDDAAEDACESAAIGRFTTRTKTAGCAACTDLGTLATFVEQTADGANGLAYCASPGGAFLD